MIDKDIELRSEKVRNIIGKMPSYFSRNGVYFVLGFILLVVACLSILPYTVVYETKITINSFPNTQLIKSPIYGLVDFKVKPEQAISKNTKIATITNDSIIIQVKSIISGNVNFQIINKSFVNENDIICEIVPDTTKYIYGELYMPLDFSNKIHQDMLVNIVMGDGSYLEGYILKTNYNIQNDSIKVIVNIPEFNHIPISQKKGNARIIIYNEKMIHRLFN